MNLTVTWTNPAIHPPCGYKMLYRRKSDSAYTTIITSGSTSGTTSLTIQPSAPASYEGSIQSDCCSDNLSTSNKWGTNAYNPIGSVVSIRVSPANYIVTITSSYPNPYATIITGNYTSNLHGVTSYTATYPAGSTSAIVVLPGSPNANSESVSATTISTIAPVFNNGGGLQQYDPINTPPYFEFIQTSGQTSGTTLWSGSPVVLPSFTLDAFVVTETDVSSNPIAGNLLVSWIQGSPYHGGTSPYDIVTLKIAENSSPGVVLGTADVSTSVNGLITLTIPIIKGVQAISITTLYKMSVYWQDITQPSPGSSQTFYLPSF